MKKPAILLLSLVLALAAGEGFLRLWTPAPVRAVHRQLDQVMEGLSTQSERRAYVPDELAGFRPLPGGAIYDVHGARYHHYPLEKRPGRRRVLFVGDSVTFRGQILRGLKSVFGEQEFEYWNVGVESYASLEMATYVRDHVQDVGFDHVVLTFHPNDTYSTPACFPVSEREFAIHVPGQGGWTIDPVWARRSYLYAFLKGAKLVNVDFRRLANARERCREGLEILAAEAERRGARLTVLRFPFMKPLDQWDRIELDAHAVGGELCEELGLEAHDLLPYFEAALDEGFEDYQQVPGDPWHLSDEMGVRFARALAADGFQL